MKYYYLEVRALKKTVKVICLTVIFTVIFTSLYGLQMVSTGRAPKMALGSQGEDVKSLQQRLKNWGYYTGEVNGSYGLDTLMAVKDFQKNWGMESSGITDAKTMIAAGMGRFFNKNEVYAQETNDNVQLMARAINGEARGEPYEGQVAVGAVILNRVNDSRFPKTIAGVIYQPGAFTAVSDGQISVPIDPNSTVVKAARDALNGWDPTDGCLYYWNPKTATSKWIWTRQIKKVIGQHYFGI